MTTQYPTREHQKADYVARRRGITAIDEIVQQALALRKTLEREPLRRVDADDTQGIADNVRKLTGFLAELGTLYDVLEWHAADLGQG